MATAPVPGYLRLQKNEDTFYITLPYWLKIHPYIKAYYRSQTDFKGKDKIPILHATRFKITPREYPVSKTIEHLKNIAELYKNADVERKQYIVGSNFPEKFVFDGEIDRTAAMNLTFHIIYQINNKTQKKKRR